MDQAASGQTIQGAWIDPEGFGRFTPGERKLRWFAERRYVLHDARLPDSGVVK